jgi:hypothetical protein
MHKNSVKKVIMHHETRQSTTYSIHMQILIIHPTTFYHSTKCVPLPVRLLRVSSARSVPLPLADRRDLTGTSQPTLGVLCFPLSPPSRKGATHYPDGTSSSQLASQGRATTPIRAGKSQLPTSKSVKSLIRQRNVTLTVDPLLPPPSSLL